MDKQELLVPSQLDSVNGASLGKLPMDTFPCVYVCGMFRGNSVPPQMLSGAGMAPGGARETEKP